MFAPRVLAALATLPALAVVPALPSADHDERPGRMVLVLDSSGSMKELTPGGQPKIDAAKHALREVIGALPERQPVGLRVYGATVFSHDDPGACTDSQLVVPVGTGNRAQLRQALKKYHPYGETPIGYALRQAAQDLGRNGKRTIVLVSDGEPTCQPDPCDVARRLARRGIHLRIDVVGLDVSRDAERALRCIADRGRGTYYDVDSADELASSLQKLAARAARPYRTIGQPVHGTPGEKGAPTIGDGDWLDSLGAAESPTAVRTYLVTRTIPGSTLRVSAAVQNHSPGMDHYTLDLRTRSGRRCGSDFSTLTLRGQLTSIMATAGPADAWGRVDRHSPCTTAEVIVATLRHRKGDQSQPVEVRVVEVPPVRDVASLAEPRDARRNRWKPPPEEGRPERVHGGSSFTNAPSLRPGTYADNIVPGELLTYQVQAQWGQRVTAVVVYADFGRQLAEHLGQQSTTVEIYGPARAHVGSPPYGDGPPKRGFLRAGRTFGASTAPILLSNRGSVVGTASLAGIYTVAVSLEADRDGGSYLVPFTLRLAVTGKPLAGPEFVRATGTPDPPAPSTTSPQSPAEAEQQPSVHPATPTSVPPTHASARPGAASPGDTGMSLPIIWIVIGALAVLVLVVTTYLLRRSSHH